ncbi:efflux RND transporter periplasmic adaptor subunit [Marinibactrum halimedae]|uniref:MexE family multidrug efflux RND transporter periplasmic adaptor subunit n=1 Tax=Marinibactrum halimedae TaxID=1444977 RepID=A0AA37T3W3_9GAMM|nr:efflux RND transporter periplasmic adaptor subunit [Marinibactrum halimedae]MCD9460082.1 efflux RND transporter periplasmic adaptor subunit [Marinibactrum halimedae]GLS26483.1 MexE family multidrug efflux RND transporter periplasmic adaptor subunit [Marinibactrum halimedae]
MNCFKRLISYAGLLSAALVLSACSDEQAPPSAGPKAGPPVTVAEVIHQDIIEWDEFTGRLEAPETVSLRPRVSGFIDEVLFTEGALVEEGDPLFRIDARPFQAEVNRLKADLVAAQSALAFAKSQYERAQRLVKQKALSQETLDSRRADFQQARASVSSVQSALDAAELDLDFTQVTSPIKGRVSRALVTKGNLVAAGQNELTTIVSTEKLFAYFDADENTYLDYVDRVQSGARQSSRNHRTPVMMALANESEFLHYGYIDFVDNQIDPQSGTIRARAVFDKPKAGVIPGLFARIRIAASASYNGILIDDKAIGTDLNSKYVLVMDENNTVQYRAVTLGDRLGELRLIQKGLEKGEVIVVNGLQRVRPGTPVTPERSPMASQVVLDKLMKQQEMLRSPIDALEASPSDTTKVNSKELDSSAVDEAMTVPTAEK